MFIERQKIRSKGLVQGPGVQKTFRLLSHTPEQFNVMPRTKDQGLANFGPKILNFLAKNIFFKTTIYIIFKLTKTLLIQQLIVFSDLL